MKLNKAEKRLGTWLKVVKQIMDGELEEGAAISSMEDPESRTW